jgi:hypothetical protein
MKDYQIYNLDRRINRSELINHCMMSRDKFNHLYGGFEHATKYYYLYNFFTIASCNSEIYLLYLEMLKCIRHYFNLYEIENTNVWMQTWMNIHTKEQILTSHSHAFPFHGYVSLSNHNTDTVFTDSHHGNELYRVKNYPLQLYLGPGYRHHHVENVGDYDDERVTLGFDIQISNTITDNFSFIPIVL